jgi:hypothetical protein
MGCFPLPQLENLQASYEDLKAQSQEEIRHLWSQLESVRTNREEPSGEKFCLGDSEPTFKAKAFFFFFLWY